jgi:hypothetical protein
LNGKSGCKLAFHSGENQSGSAKGDNGAFKALNSTCRHFPSELFHGDIEAMTPFTASTHQKLDSSNHLSLICQDWSNCWLLNFARRIESRSQAQAETIQGKQEHHPIMNRKMVSSANALNARKASGSCQRRICRGVVNDWQDPCCG